MDQNLTLTNVVFEYSAKKSAVASGKNNLTLTNVVFEC